MTGIREYRYQLEALNAGKWRRLWGAKDRLELDQYIASCNGALEMRVVDTWEEEREHGRRRKQDGS